MDYEEFAILLIQKQLLSILIHLLYYIHYLLEEILLSSNRIEFNNWTLMENKQKVDWTILN